jgi:hypothetical protein
VTAVPAATSTGAGSIISIVVEWRVMGDFRRW